MGSQPPTLAQLRNTLAGVRARLADDLRIINEAVAAGTGPPAGARDNLQWHTHQRDNLLVQIANAKLAQAGAGPA